jgi:hypothetical protein
MSVLNFSVTLKNAFHIGMSFHSAGDFVIFHAVMTEQLNP